MTEKLTCQHCNKGLVPMGNRRKSGAPTVDWDSRKYHKKCHKILSDRIIAKLVHDARTEVRLECEK